MTTPTRIASTFVELKSKGHMAFMPFVTAGDPDLETSLSLIRELAQRGIDLIEVGFPYSDPIADGPVIQASYTRALQNELRVSDIFAGIKSLVHNSQLSTLNSQSFPPLVAMVSYAIVSRSDPKSFVEQAIAAGFSGLIVPDLPADEADELAQLVQSRGLDLIQLIAPTTPRERASRILNAASGFVYCISVAGTTGMRDQLPAELADQLKWLRNHTDLPLAVGFGISKPEHVAALRGVADGVIVGSALVSRMEPLANESTDRSRIIADIGQFATKMVQATRA